MKRNSESRYRQKIISKYYMNKSQQKQLDNIINHPSRFSIKTTYKEMYLKPKIETMLFILSNVNQCEILLKRCGVDIITENGYKSTYDVLSELSEKWK